jgi:hypothetical protein
MNEWKRKACKRGHVYVEGSWTWTTSGNRDCKECKRIREANTREKHKRYVEYAKESSKLRLSDS